MRHLLSDTCICLSQSQQVDAPKLLFKTYSQYLVRKSQIREENMATMARQLLMVAHSAPVPFMDRSSSAEHVKLNHTRMTSPFSFLISQKAGLTCSRSASFRVCTMIGRNKSTVYDRTPPNMGHRKMQMHAGWFLTSFLIHDTYLRLWL